MDPIITTLIIFGTCTALAALLFWLTKPIHGAHPPLPGDYERPKSWSVGPKDGDSCHK